MPAATMWVLGILAANPDLERAQRAYDAALFQDVLPALDAARRGQLNPREAARAFELEAKTHAAFGASDAAVEAFRRLLAIDPSYAPDANQSPKLHELFEQARALGPWPAPSPKKLTPPPTVATPTPPFVEPKPTAVAAVPVTRRWYFWAGVGAATAAAVGLSVYAAQPRLPNGNLGRGELR